MSHSLTLPILSCFSITLLMACSGSDGSGNPIPNNSSSTPAMSDSTGSTTGTTSIPMIPVATEEGLIGPSGGSGKDGEYAQFNDSPFANLDFGDGYFYFEDFEDKILEHPGASASTGNFVSLEFGEGFHDSVDADDGLIDGNSLNGESWFYDVSSTGIIWSFNETELNGQLPTHVGIVWTDGRNDTSFEAFDASGQTLGIIVSNHDDASFNGETGEDRFYGVVHYAGVSAIKISNDNRFNGIELDHLQWGYLPVDLR